MRISVVARHMELTDAMREYAEDKMGKLPHLYDGVQKIDVTFSMEGGQFTVEIVASGKRKSVFVARHRNEDLYACMDQCAHKVQEQLRRHKDRVRNRQGPPHDQTVLREPPPGM